MKIRDLALQARLGWSSEERARPQEIRVSIELRFFQEPKGALSDELEDTICYGGLSDALREYAEKREFRLVERMARDFHGVVKGLVEERAKVSLTVHKVRPPVTGLMGGVEYTVKEVSS